ncbi:MAG: HAD family hydrolase [Alphaproteobacteria bacterium]
MPSEIAAVFLDRDGVLNHSIVRGGKPYAPRRLTDFRLVPGTREAVRRLKDAGFRLVVVTNQPDIGNGVLKATVVNAMHQRLADWLPLDGIEMCPHPASLGCDCRKPKDGMLRRAAARFGISLTSSYMIGDRASDIVAGQSAGCYSIFLDRSYGEPRPESPDHVALNLADAVDHVLHREGCIAA